MFNIDKKKKSKKLSVLDLALPLAVKIWFLEKVNPSRVVDPGVLPGSESDLREETGSGSDLQKKSDQNYDL